MSEIGFAWYLHFWKTRKYDVPTRQGFFMLFMAQFLIDSIF